MRNSEGLAQVALLQAYYPGAGRELPRETVELWARALERYELGDASEAVQLIASHGAFMPSLAELEREIIEIRNARILRENTNRPAIPAAASSRTEPAMSLTEYLADPALHDDEHGHAEHLRSVRKCFPTLARQIFDRAAASDLSADQAHKRLEKHDYHSRARIAAASVIVRDAMLGLGITKPEGSGATAAFD